MKHAGALLTLVIFLFWGTMNLLVFLRQREIQSLDQYRAGVTDFLGTDLFRERWMGIYRNFKKVGYTGDTYEKVFAAEGVEIHCTLESVMQFEFLGMCKWLKATGRLVLDDSMKPVRLRLDVVLDDGEPFTISGRRQGGEFRLSLQRGLLKLLDLAYPLKELHLGNGLVPSLPVSGLQVGDAYAVPCFDPISMRQETATVKVLFQEVKNFDGLLVDAFCLESSYRGLTSRSWVTAAGEVLRQEFGPPLDGIVLKREKRDQARSYSKR